MIFRYLFFFILSYLSFSCFVTHTLIHYPTYFYLLFDSAYLKETQRYKDDRNIFVGYCNETLEYDDDFNELDFSKVVMIDY